MMRRAFSGPSGRHRPMPIPTLSRGGMGRDQPPTAALRVFQDVRTSILAEKLSPATRWDGINRE